jgi:hypothetical protein
MGFISKGYKPKKKNIVKLQKYLNGKYNQLGKDLRDNELRERGK